MAVHAGPQTVVPVALLEVEGRPCTVRPLRGSGIGRVCGPAVVVDSLAALQVATGWLPGRILVLGPDALEPACLAHLERLPPGAFVAVVALTDAPDALASLRLPGGQVPAVAVLRPTDREMVRRGVLICVTVAEASEPHHRVPAPRRPRRRPGMPQRGGVPGTIDLRPHR